MLEHFRCVNCRHPLHLQALYAPPRLFASSGDLTAKVVLNDDAAERMRQQLALAGLHGGAPFTVAIPAMRADPLPHPHIVPAYADAATDSAPPGLGGYCHGLFWYIELSPVHVTWLHITALELLATGFNAIAFSHVLSP
eukprot:534610-Pleurochrysis_carterae.AAC.1